MKRISFFLVVFAIIFSVANVSAQEKELTPAQKRKIERQQKDQIEAQQVQQAIASQNFDFLGNDMIMRDLDRVSLRAPYDRVEVTPDLLRVSLFYYTSENTMGNTWPILDFETTDFTYKVTERKGVYTIVIDAKAVKDRNTIIQATQSRSYQLVFVVGGSGQNMQLTLSPSFTGPVNYTGMMKY